MNSALIDSLQAFDFVNLFKKLGWDYHKEKFTVPLNAQTFTLQAVAKKRGMVALVCQTASLLPYKIRRQIERKVAEQHYENLVIYTDQAQTEQVWQWIKREHGKPDVCREERYNPAQKGEALLQKLQQITFTLTEEDDLTLLDVAKRTRKAFEVEKVTKTFYSQFQKEHDAFRHFVTGISDEEMKSWYVSVMLKRLMFLYFLQKKGFLDNNRHYLRTKLIHFLNHAPERYYADFLGPLFFEGFAKPPNQRSSAVMQLLGDIPYLNGGLFLKHQIEMQFRQTLQIADAAFERLFTFFERYTWRLDAHLLGQENELNPTLLGYLFEKQINQKEMGAYYTKEDITEYLSKNTIIPALLHSVQKRIPHFFEREQALWQLLTNKPQRYLYEAVKHGLDLTLPEAIKKGLNDVRQRNEWQKSAPEAYALPTETWREVVARRQRATELLCKLANGEINQINDLITYNLNIRQFAQDVIEECEDLELLKALWQALQTLTILDPACGSGAFLFAALNILEPLYSACLQRFESFAPANPVFQTKTKGAYFLLKTIMLNNLYGVDLMPEATEICKLRLLLKLIAQLDDVSELDLLPNLDSNLRVGNSLVGFVQKEAAKNNQKELETPQPFHWFIEFPEVMQRGGFEVIIGNPPYVEYSKVKKDYQIEGYETEKCGNLYAFMIERSLQLLQKEGQTGMIIPLAAISTERMRAVQSLLTENAATLWLSSYAMRPAKLFAGAEQHLAIYLLQKGPNSASKNYSSRYHRWYEEFRPNLFALIAYTKLSKGKFTHSFPKLAEQKEQQIWDKLQKYSWLGTELVLAKRKELVFFHNAPRYWIRALDFVPYFWSANAGEQRSSHLRPLYLGQKAAAPLVLATLNSNLFFWWFVILSNGRDLSLREIQQFPLGIAQMNLATKQKLSQLATELMLDLRHHAQRKECFYKATGKVVYDKFYPKQSKPIIDEIDKVLAQHYGFTPEELDFILNYDLKYRLGKETASKEE